MAFNKTATTNVLVIYFIHRTIKSQISQSDYGDYVSNGWLQSRPLDQTIIVHMPVELL
jgi:hypothetical protein